MREGWKEVRLDEVCFYITDGAHLSPKSVDSGIPMASVKDMHDFGFNYNSCRQISFEDYLKLKKGNCEPQNDDVLIAKDGSYLKHCFVYKDEPKQIALLSSIAIFRPDKGKILPEFLAYLFKSDDVKGKARNYVSGVAIPRIVLSDFKKMTLDVPPLPTQRKIASILSAYDDLIENNLKRIKLLEEKAQLTYEEWFVKMRFPGYETAKFDEVTGLPEGWEKVKLGEVTEFKYGKMPKPEHLTKSGYPVYSGYRITGYTDKYLFEKPTLIIVARGVGGTGDVKISPEKCWLTNLSIALQVKETIFQNYLYYHLKDSNLRSLDSGAAQSQITIANLESYFVINADYKLQVIFNDFVDTIFKNTNNLQAQNRLLKEARDILLPRLMSGMVDVEELGYF